MAIDNSWACIGVAILTAHGDKAASQFEQAVLKEALPRATLERTSIFQTEPSDLATHERSEHKHTPSS